MEEKKQLATEAGRPVADNPHVETVGGQGPTRMQNVWLRGKQAHFNRKRISQQIAHTPGSRASGTFTVTNDIKKYTQASLVGKVGKKTDLFLCFAVVPSKQGKPDTQRDMRGFAVLFYPQEGDGHLVSNHTSVFVARHPLQFAASLHLQKRVPRKKRFVKTSPPDVWPLNLESLHQAMILRSGRNIPQNDRRVHGFGSPAYSLLNRDSKRLGVKFKLLFQRGVANYTPQESEKIHKKNRDYTPQDLFGRIEKGYFSKWKMNLQILFPKKAATCRIHAFDLTTVWPHEDYSFRGMGEIKLKHHPKNYFTDLQQSASDPARIVSGRGCLREKIDPAFYPRPDGSPFVAGRQTVRIGYGPHTGDSKRILSPRGAISKQRKCAGKTPVTESNIV